ncbi:hypothetical protein [Nocardioides currus]|uniref:Uncharacterized protein n=1 Tax=Nocardioides currus TaxID=2133958 RepID=A0A2R7YTZ0_9ACTN|nr:hypothetical protein [Nocardioides currus]PUA79870.1 hypothetical protein C7S10_17585 [Nocardioides currus]
MTNELFKAEVDRIDSGLPDHPDLTSYMRSGRAIRRRRRGAVALGAGALAAAVVTPAVLWGGGPATQPAKDPAPSSVAPAASAPAPVDASFGDGVTAAVAEGFPDAAFLDKTVGDHYEKSGIGVEPALGTPPDWANVFFWRQGYAVDGLQFFDTRASWDGAAAPAAGCSSTAFEVEQQCTTTDVNGYTVVVHDGVHVQGEPEGDWARLVQVVAPISERGNTQVTEVMAQVEGMSWAEAESALPDIDRMRTLALDERLRLPEPATIPELR